MDADNVLGPGYQEQRSKPLRERNFGALEDGPDRDSELLSAGRFIALVDTRTVRLASKLGDLVLIRVAAMRADRTFRPRPAFQPSTGSFFVLKDRVLQARHGVCRMRFAAISQTELYDHSAVTWTMCRPLRWTTGGPHRAATKGSCKHPNEEVLMQQREIWSGRRGSNPRPRPWQGRALPLSYTRIRNCCPRPSTGNARPMPNAHRDCNSPAAAGYWRNRRILRPKPPDRAGTMHRGQPVVRF